MVMDEVAIPSLKDVNVSEAFVSKQLAVDDSLSLVVRVEDQDLAIHVLILMHLRSELVSSNVYSRIADSSFDMRESIFINVS